MSVHLTRLTRTVNRGSLGARDYSKNSIRPRSAEGRFTMASLMTLASAGQPIDKHWLLALRIGTLILVTLSVAVAIPALLEWDDRGPVVLCFFVPVLTFVLILLALGSNPPGKFCLAVLVALGSLTFMLASVSLPFVLADAVRKLRWQTIGSEPIWGQLALLNFTILVSAIGGYVRLTRKGGVASWAWAIRILAGVSILLACFPFIGYLRDLSRMDTWLAPLTRVLALLATVFVYVVVLWGLREGSRSASAELRRALFITVISGLFLMLYFAQAYGSSLYYTENGPLAADLVAVLIFILLALGSGVYAGIGIRTYYLMKREDGDVRTLLKGFATAGACGLVFILGSAGMARHEHGMLERRALGSLWSIKSAEVEYASKFSASYSPSLQALGPPPEGGSPGPSAANLIHSVMASGRWVGYLFTYTPGPPDSAGRITSYTLRARPIQYRRGSRRSYYTDHLGVIRFTKENRDATAQDPPLP